MKKVIAFVLLTFFFTSSLCASTDDELLNKLSNIEGLTVNELPSEQGYRIFELGFKQAADHTEQDGETFEQRLVLWHKGVNRPMVLQTSGYRIFGIALSGLAQEFNANQIQVEHRFFGNSTPKSKNWRLMNIAQSAADFHEITQAFKSIYSAKWVNTGRSKGGMTSVYHRRFYPSDLDATVAHVAPQSYSTVDSRYGDFVSDLIGGEENAACRQKLIDSQRVLLLNRENLHDAIDGDFTFLGSKEIALEHAIIELPWQFWQYHTPDEHCDNVPNADAPFTDHFDFLVKINDPIQYSDSEIERFSPYYFQAATQLGNPLTPTHEIEDLLYYRDSFNVFNYAPKESQPVYDDALAMRDIKQWLAQQSTRMLFVYGEWDPWSAGAFEPNTDPSSDSFIFYVPKTNHSAQFLDLQGEERKLAYMRLRKWLNIENETTYSQRTQHLSYMTLEDLEFEAGKHFRH